MTVIGFILIACGSFAAGWGFGDAIWHGKPTVMLLGIMAWGLGGLIILSAP